MARVVEIRSARPAVQAPAQVHLRIDPSVCEGVGICAHLAPDLIAVDSWGYPILFAGPLTARTDVRQAEAAVAACPRKALYVER